MSLSLAPELPDPCNHPRQEPRERWVRNGTKHFVLQCLVCGSQVRPLRRDEIAERQDAMVNRGFDEDLQRQYQEERRREIDHWRARRDQIRQHRADLWWNRYNAYLDSTEWQERRQRRLQLDNFQCQARMVGCTGRASDVHHLTYDHVFDEPLFDLISVCRMCHDKITAMDRERRSA